MLLILTILISSELSCDDCKKFVTDHYDALTNLDLKSFLNENICKIDHLSEKKEDCIKVTDALIETITGKISSMNPSLLCGLFAKCRPTIQDHNSMKMKKGLYRKHKINDNLDSPKVLNADQYPNCEYCKDLWGFLLGDGATTFTSDIARDTAIDICKQIPEAKQFCDVITTEHAFRAVQMLTAKFNNEQLCAAGGLCPSS
ncbi:hypothetical protein TRFO_12887 [Tritrichomonas foetus]|uniref:Saposin B-type domain-containing protein n=1 Tax=Tritrichomonas foetus TaxID=1144522 RepID=A0A1J4L4A9_9EUKA|nr:hypothetical protein TRFO_12887 [Tritrichomonas foetus]|eukprot:OHT16812.1 hypothetical protein TRFO_12887 [Tritrichomonas foetus]